VTGSVALGVKVFTRVDKLADLLDTANHPLVETVYVADDGEITDEKRELYDQEYDFELELLDLEYDTGLGYGRKKICESLSEEYLLILDSDMLVPKNIEILQAQLEAEPSLGGVSGTIVENNRFRGGAGDLFEEGDILVRDIRDAKEIQTVSGYPLVMFDMIRNAAMFRKECLDDYTWDENYKIGYEHPDFFLGHKRRTDWQFGLSPNVTFQHFPGGDQPYLDKRKSKTRLDNSKGYFLEKWGFDAYIKYNNKWIESYKPGTTPVGLINDGIRFLGPRTPVPLQKKFERARQFYRNQRKFR